MLNLIKPKVELENVEEVRQIDSDAIATAKTTVSYESVGVDKIDVEKSKGLLKRLILPGHLTPFLNRNIVFRIEGISRNASTWLHYVSTYYNTGQYSQRYLKLSGNNDIPPLYLPSVYSKLPEELKQEIEKFFTRRNDDYKRVMKLHGSELVKRGSTDSVEKGEKIATQYARDVFPNAVFTAMRHSTNIIQLGRLYILSLKTEMPEDLEIAIDMMWNKVKEFNKFTCSAIEDIYGSEEIFQLTGYDADASYSWLNSLLGNEIIKLYSNDFYEHLSEELKIMGIHANKEALKEIFMKYNEKNFRNAFGFQNVTMAGKVFNNLLGFGFFTKMSHSQLEQSIRHRKMNHNVNLLLPLYLSEPDYIVPPPLRYNDEIKEIFWRASEETWELKDKLISYGMKPVDISYILPRGTAYLVSVSGSFNDLRHYLNLRSCASAQFNIYEMAISLIEQMERKFNIPPMILGPKCIHAKKCVEGPRTCNLFPWLDEKGLNNVLKRRLEKGF